MALTMKERKAVTREVATRYQRATKGEKRLILDEFIKLTGYNRSYAAYLLRNWGRKIGVRLEGKDTVIILGKKEKEVRGKLRGSMTKRSYWP